MQAGAERSRKRLREGESKRTRQGKTARLKLISVSSTTTAVINDQGEKGAALAAYEPHACWLWLTAVLPSPASPTVTALL